MTDALERAEILFGRSRISYVVRRSARRSTVSISIDPDVGVLLAAPAHANGERLEQLVRAKAPWILAHMKGRAELPAARQFVSGETFLYLGRQYRLRVARSAGVGGVGLRGAWLSVDSHSGGNIRDLLVTWYRQHAEARLGDRVEAWSARLKMASPKLTIREQRRRWGSWASDGTMRLNWRIIQAPASLVDYVVAHELVHGRYADHSPAFWAALGRVMPDYDARRGQLRKLGPRLSW